jgi:uridine kinase
VIGERPECLRMDLFTEELRRRQFGEDDILFVDGFLLFHSLEICELLDVKVSF